MAQFSRGLVLGFLLGAMLLALTWAIAFMTTTPGPVSAAPALSATARPTLVVAVADAAGATEPPPTAMPTPAPPATPTPTPGASVPFVLPSPTPDCRVGAARIERGTFYSATVGRDRPYRVYLPPCYDESATPLPVVYMLHGSIQNDSQWDDDGLDEAATQAIQAGHLVPFVIAMPAGDLDGTFNNSSGGPGSFEQVMLDDFIPFVEQQYHVRSDRGGRAIGGLSRGAVWALEIAFRHPDLFLSVGAHSGAQSVAVAPPDYHPLALAAQASGLDQLRIYMDTGENDWYREGVDQLHATLTARKIPHGYVINPGTHEDAYWKAHVAEYVEFYGGAWSVPAPAGEP